MMVKCDEARLIELLRGELPPDGTEETLGHIDECRKCRERFRVMAILETEPDLLDKSNRVFSIAKIVLLAACILIALGGTFLYRSLSGNETPGNRLAALATSEAYPYIPTEVRNSESAWQTEQIQAAFVHYQAGDYRAAFQTFPPDSQAFEISFYRGISAYMAGQTEPAILDLRRASQSETWKQPSLWYLANAYLKAGERSRAKQLMQRLKSTANYGKLADLLLEEIESDN